jgi:hypothetical protein
MATARFVSATRAAGSPRSRNSTNRRATMMGKRTPRPISVITSRRVFGAHSRWNLSQTPASMSTLATPRLRRAWVSRLSPRAADSACCRVFRK